MVPVPNQLHMEPNWDWCLCTRPHTHGPPTSHSQPQSQPMSPLRCQRLKSSCFCPHRWLACRPGSTHHCRTASQVFAFGPMKPLHTSFQSHVLSTDTRNTVGPPCECYGNARLQRVALLYPSQGTCVQKKSLKMTN